MDTQHTSSEPTLAVITVCIDADTADLAIATARTLPREVVSADVDAYLAPGRYQYFPQPVKSATYCIALVDYDQDPEAAVETAAQLNQMFYGKIAVLALSSDSGDQFTDSLKLLHVVRSGFTDLLGIPLDSGELADSLSRIAQRWPNTAGQVKNTANILSFFGAKGGVGTSTLVVHLAVYLAMFHNKKTLLIDHHPQLGHACLYLGLEGLRYDFYELLTNVTRLDKELLAGFIATHASGLDVLGSPSTYGLSPVVDPRAMELAIDFLSEQYDYILIDCATSFEPSNETIMERSDQVYLVATPDIGAIRDLSAFVDQLVKTSQVKATMHVVMNRYGSREAVSVEQIEKAIRLPISIRIPNSFAELINAINIGELVLPGKKTPFSVQMTKWVNAIVGVEQGAAPVVEKKKALAFWR